ncbi:hypothetical protein [Parathalassolituus penaei]|uniref:Uncharacterized protein n=1 Tax=Parathalassolituus penaei TaxID=2997323 RepID=A0A9X3EE37_9GAMM|nr:hypothetical protein [Parathalassolituus penaei]MCY0965864.1 hypothetical protein [Parathalassolituus penaei]
MAQLPQQWAREADFSLDWAFIEQSTRILLHLPPLILARQML